MTTTPNPAQAGSLADWAPAVRGLYARSTGDADTPWQPVILKVEAETSSPAGTLEITPATDEAGEVDRETLAKAFEDYKTGGQIPSAVSIKGLGVLKPAPDDTSLDGQPLRQHVALVTGAAGAIGRGICHRLLELGACVAAADLPGAALDGFQSEYAAQFGERVQTVPIDVTSEESVKAGFDLVCERWGGLDIVVINAGIAHVAALTELPLATFQKLERVNVDGTLLTLAAASRVMKRQATGGDIVLVSTKNVFAPGARFGAYSATKAASHQLARIASLELAEFGIRVNMVAPDGVFSDDGKTKSGLWATVGPDRMKARGLDEKGLEDYYRNRNLLKMRVTSRHVANAVVFFVTHQTPTTGATIPIDGGLPDATPR